MLAVTIEATGEAAVLKLLRFGGTAMRRAERELYSLDRLKNNVGVPTIRASSLDRERQEMLLVVSAPGGVDGKDLGEVMRESGLPWASTERDRRERICLAMAQAVQRSHAPPGRTALLDMKLSNFCLSPDPAGPLEGGMSLTAVDFGRAVSPAMQRERPDLTTSATFNVFAQDVYALGTVWAAEFRMEKDVMVQRMLSSMVGRRPTMSDVVEELAARIGV